MKTLQELADCRGVRYEDVKESIENFITEFISEAKEKAPEFAEKILDSHK